MCILFIYRNPEPCPGGYRLIIASNRDEYYARPAKSAHYWLEYPGCLGGTDEEPGKEGGTWLAINYKTGRAGIILNLNGTPKSSVGKGRGFLVRDYLTTPDSTMTHANNLHRANQETQCYNPYNLVMVDLRNSDVHYLSSLLNYPGPTLIKDNIIGFGNSGFENPYKKVSVGKKKFEKIIDESSVFHQEKLIEELIQFLKQEERHLPDNELLTRSPDKYEELSAIFVSHINDEYGTRSHCIILVNDLNEITFVEETLKEDGLWKRQTFTNKLV